VSTQARATACTPLRTADRYLEQLAALHVSGVKAILTKGGLLNEAKTKLEHGEWQALCRRLPFSQRHAHRFRAIATHPTLSNRTFVAILPEDLVVLYQMSRLAPEIVEAAIRDGRIHSRMALQDARELTRGRAGDPHERITRRTSKPWTLLDAFTKIRRALAGAPTAAHPEVATELRELADRYTPSRPQRTRARAEQLKPEVAKEIITAGFRSVAHKYHPDHSNGDVEMMKAINLAMAWLRALVG
jgi:hypothetical protein